MRQSRYALLLVGIMLVWATTAVAGRIESVNETVEMEGAERLVIECDFGAGELYIVPEDIPEAARLKITYDKRHFDYSIDYDPSGDVGYLFLESDTRRASNIRSADNEWDVILSTRHPTELELDIGACEADLDLGGIPLTEVSMDIGAASGTIDFSARNPERMDDLEVDIGASSVELLNLGNANFDRMQFSSGAASCELDFRGEFRGESDVTLDIGLGSAKIILPEGLAVRIEIEGDNWFSSIDFHNDDLDEVDDDIFETPDFDRADDRIVISVDVGMGSADFYFR